MPIFGGQNCSPEVLRGRKLRDQRILVHPWLQGFEWIRSALINLWAGLNLLLPIQSPEGPPPPQKTTIQPRCEGESYLLLKRDGLPWWAEILLLIFWECVCVKVSLNKRSERAVTYEMEMKRLFSFTNQRERQVGCGRGAFPQTSAQGAANMSEPTDRRLKAGLPRSRQADSATLASGTQCGPPRAS